MNQIFENVQERTKAATYYVSRKSKILYSITQEKTQRTTQVTRQLMQDTKLKIAETATGATEKTKKIVSETTQKMQQSISDA